ncbi:MAG: aconitate hydratase AcnA [bacterium]|nr:aconitate hydratase AcnA [bacterium]
MTNSFQARAALEVGGQTYEIFRLDALKDKGDIARLPYSLKVLLENLLRNEDGRSVTAADIEALAGWSPENPPHREIGFMPSRVILQDFTGVPAVVDLAVMRDAMKRMGGDPNRINPLQPVDLVIDHSVQVDAFGTADALDKNAEIEYERNAERYAFLRWAQQAFDNFRVVPPETGIVHQVNLEYLAHVVATREKGGILQAFPDTLVGTDSHTTMINGLGVLGWGVGGIEAEAAMLGQSYSMLIPEVIGFKLSGRLPEGATATDLVLVVVQMLRKKGVVGKFVEFFGPGLADLPLADRATISNMAPEYGATCGIFPIDAETLKYLKLTGRSAENIALVEAYARAQGMFRDKNSPEARYTGTLELDLASVEPCISGPKRPQDRILLREAKDTFERELDKMLAELSGGAGGGVAAPAAVQVKDGTKTYALTHGAVVIAAITSCTNTSNPYVMLAAGLVAKKAAERGLQSKPWVKTSLAPGSKVVTEYLQKAGLDTYLDQLGFQTVGYGCTTCIGNSGPLPPHISKAISEGDLVVASVLSGNRNFEGRVHAEVRMNFLASPPLVVAYALAGHMGQDIATEPIGEDKEGSPVYLRDIWPSQSELQQVVLENVKAEMFQKSYADVFRGDLRWMALPTPKGDLYEWDPMSTYVQPAPYFDGMKPEPDPVEDIKGARCLVSLGDSTTTDHISPAGAIKKDGPAGRFLIMNDVVDKDFNSFGSRRGNHEVMMRGTFANVRLRNRIAPGTEGGWAVHFPSCEQVSIFDAAQRYREEGVPTIAMGGAEYGSGSSRDWAAKGPSLLGIRAVIAKSFERIHRSNLLGMGVLPLQFKAGEGAEELGLTGREVFDIEGLQGGEAKEVKVTALPDDGGPVITFTATVRIDTPNEVLYYQNGGILQYVLRQLLKS